ncbi:Chaperone protein DnaK [Corynebacterium occultum]|uniref:Chaperone protein DnaK n=1 Tax=Corynebacterium occultum TaxID=2675219 RepID=A0A6B8WDH4_9CORY|nr:Hsp70 family protein [Corynebacterium occultum]QGU08050.1 Chaperone protein DnaK [Corynebacterium occultum]
MRFGIDFGTTRTTAAVVDRGNYPVMGVEDTLGDAQEYIPSVVALDGDRLVAGWEAVELGEDNPTFIRSFKRLMAAEEVTAATPVRLGESHRPLGEVLETFATYVIDRLRHHQRQIGDDSAIEVALGVPANSHSAQRLLTLDAFRRAGATVLGLVNEPSAAAFEYTHRHPTTLNSRRSSVIVYDLGGGTFDVTLVRIDGHEHEVLTSLGVSRLGGDDFDEVLADFALETSGHSLDAFGNRARGRLVDEARSAKENLVPQSRRLVLELGDKDVVIPVADYYEKVTPLVERTLAAMEPLIGRDAEQGLKDTDIAGVYLVGGASSLPLVPRLLRERFGRRVHRSPFPGASTAVGLAIAADPESGYHLRDRLARGIGVFRELDAGKSVSFDALVAPDTDPGEDGFIRVTRSYQAAHNVGWFRFVEYSADDTGSEHPGDLSLIAEILVPFDPSLQNNADLSQVPVERRQNGPMVTETVTVDPDGITSIRIEFLDDSGTPVVVESTVSLRSGAVRA